MTGAKNPSGDLGFHLVTTPEQARALARRIAAQLASLPEDQKRAFVIELDAERAALSRRIADLQRQQAEIANEISGATLRARAHRAYAALALFRRRP